MNLVSEIGAQKTDRDDEDDIILGEDWEKDERGEFTFEDATRGPRNWIALNSSPLARKIITFNLLALVVLVGGVLYLSQSRDGLVVQLENTLLSEARLMAKVFEA